MSGPRRYKLEPKLNKPKSKLDLEGALNEAQRDAVESDAHRILILAGAGTGKTRTLTFRVARLIEKGTPAEGIVLATFTNRAAAQMKHRIEALLGASAQKVRAGTFHSLAHRTLRRHAEALGFDKNFGIIAREDQRDLMNAAIADLQLDIKKRRFPSADVLATLLSLAINTQRPVSEVLTTNFERFSPLGAQIDQVLSLYTRRKVEMNLMDFDDLLLNWKSLLHREDATGRGLTQEVHHVLVDEYQDTNHLQAEIAQRLAAHTENLCVVGDDAQSIYAFRGARFDNILDFPRDGQTEVHQLTENYRSTSPIIQLANAVIKENIKQFPKVLTTTRKSTQQPVLVPARDTHQEAQFIAQRILELRDEGVPLREQAVLYRAHRQAIELQMELSRHDVPYVVRSGKRFFEQAHVKDLLSFLRVLVNPLDELAWRRALTMIPGMGNKLAARAWALVQTALASPPADYLAALGADTVLDRFPNRVQDGIYQLALLLDHLSGPRLLERPQKVIHCVLHPAEHDLPEEAALLFEHVSTTYPNANDRLEELQQLAEIAGQEDSLETFLTEVALLSDYGGEDSATKERDEEGYITLSTVHQAKGLEWRAVFVAGAADGQLPLNNALMELDGEAEERRLFYVAVTRAKDQLYLSYPCSRVTRDRDNILMRPSRFISDLIPDLYEKWLLE